MLILINFFSLILFLSFVSLSHLFRYFKCDISFFSFFRKVFITFLRRKSVTSYTRLFIDPCQLFYNDYVIYWRNRFKTGDTNSGFITQHTGCSKSRDCLLSYWVHMYSGLSPKKKRLFTKLCFSHFQIQHTFYIMMYASLNF